MVLTDAMIIQMNNHCVSPEAGCHVLKFTAIDGGDFTSQASLNKHFVQSQSCRSRDQDH
jgi:hypothetical protein